MCLTEDPAAARVRLSVLQASFGFPPMDRRGKHLDTTLQKQKPPGLRPDSVIPARWRYAV
jgi:hypothetical protein